MPELGRQNSRVVSVRMTETQYHHLVAQAHLGEQSLAEAMRQALERDIDAQPDLPIEGNAPGDPGLSYRAFLGNADFTQAIEELDASQS